MFNNTYCTLLSNQDLRFPQTLHWCAEYEQTAEAEGVGKGVECASHPSPLCSIKGLFCLWGAVNDTHLVFHMFHMLHVYCVHYSTIPIRSSLSRSTATQIEGWFSVCAWVHVSTIKLLCFTDTQSLYLRFLNGVTQWPYFLGILATLAPKLLFVLDWVLMSSSPCSCWIYPFCFFQMRSLLLRGIFGATHFSQIWWRQQQPLY